MKLFDLFDQERQFFPGISKFSDFGLFAVGKRLASIAKIGSLIQVIEGDSVQQGEGVFSNFLRCPVVDFEDAASSTDIDAASMSVNEAASKKSTTLFPYTTLFRSGGGKRCR